MKADREKVERLLKTARGQIDGVLRMIDKDHYCIDISNQVLAAQKVLQRANSAILEAHLRSCVAEAMNEGEQNQKIDEIILLLEKMQK